MFKFKFNYKVGYAFTPIECQTILKDLEKQQDKFLVTDDHGDLCLSVYETEISNLDDNKTKELIEYRLKELEKKLNLKFDLERFVIKYDSDRRDMQPHYDGSCTTTLIYLNNTYVGGSTIFPLAKKEHKPQKFKPGHFINYDSNHILSYHGGMPVTNGVKYAIALRSFKLSLWGAITILPWRIFRDVFFERFMADRIVKRINPLVAKAFPQHYLKKNKS